jgi:hypothetical protein
VGSCFRASGQRLRSDQISWVRTAGVLGCRNITHLLLLERQANLEYLDRKEGEFCVEAALDVCGLAKPVLLT